MLKTRKVDNNEIHKVLFVSLRPLYLTVLKLLRRMFRKWVCSVFSGDLSKQIKDMSRHVRVSQLLMSCC